LKRVAILGSTGSIGLQALDVARRHPEQIEVAALAVGSRAQALLGQVNEFHPEAVAIADECVADTVRDSLEGLGVHVLSGPSAAEDLVRHVKVDTILSAISGFSGLGPTLAAAASGADLALANKESVVCAGPLLLDEIARSGSSLVPVDSEHSAIFQCIHGDEGWVDRLVITASGGPFLDRALHSFDAVTPSQALAHPRWEMGAKISIDSATMMNKGLEIIEARWLFDMDFDLIDVVIHPESVVHSLVQLRDGSLKAHLGPTDMRYAIMYGFSHPERWQDPGYRDFRLAEQSLTFSDPDPERFPCLSIARAAGEEGGLLPTVLVSADEVAVRAFLDGDIRFPGIARVVEETLERASGAGMGGNPRREPEEILRADEWARKHARSIVAMHAVQ